MSFDEQKTMNRAENNARLAIITLGMSVQTTVVMVTVNARFSGIYGSYIAINHRKTCINYYISHGACATLIATTAIENGERWDSVHYSRSVKGCVVPLALSCYHADTSFITVELACYKEHQRTSM